MRPLPLSIRLALLALGGALAAVGPAAAQAQATAAACASPDHRALDFWLGRWSVVDEATGAPVGENHIQALWGGCAVLEDFSSADGFRGGSLSQWDAARKVWRLAGGGSTGAAMVFEGQASAGRLELLLDTTAADGSPRRLRMVLEARADGTVRQASDSSSDGGRTWRPRYAYVYRRSGAGGA